MVSKAESGVFCIVSNFHVAFAYCTMFSVVQAVSLYFCVHAFIYHARLIQFA